MRILEALRWVREDFADTDQLDERVLMFVCYILLGCAVALIAFLIVATFLVWPTWAKTAALIVLLALRSLWRWLEKGRAS